MSVLGVNSVPFGVDLSQEVASYRRSVLVPGVLIASVRASSLYPAHPRTGGIYVA